MNNFEVIIIKNIKTYYIAYSGTANNAQELTNVSAFKSIQTTNSVRI